MIPYGRQDISQADIDSVVGVLRSNFLTQGPLIPSFESGVAEYAGANFAVAVNSATSALHIACLALDVGVGDAVWTSPNTFVATSNAALYCGASVDFVDIDPLTYNISVERLSEKLALARIANELPKVVIPVHFAGQSCDMAAIYALSKEYGFRIIEDASHAIGGKYKNTLVGGCSFSDITIFSFHPVKIITTGEGGMALTNDASLFERMIRFRSHGITSNQGLMQARPADEIWNYQQIDIGFNYRITEIQAALGLSQLKRLDEFIGKRHEIAKNYNERLGGLSVTLPQQSPGARSSFHLYPIRVSESTCGISQRELYNAFFKAGIGVNVHYIPVYRQPYYEALGFRAGYCPEAEQFHREVISLPIFPALTDQQQEYVINFLSDLIGNS